MQLDRYWANEEIYYNYKTMHRKSKELWHWFRMTFVIKVCVNIASSPWIGHRGSPTSTLDNTITTTNGTICNQVGQWFYYNLTGAVYQQDPQGTRWAVDNYLNWTELCCLFTSADSDQPGYINLHSNSYSLMLNWVTDSREGSLQKHTRTQSQQGQTRPCPNPFLTLT